MVYPQVQSPNTVGPKGVIFLVNAFSPNMLSKDEVHIYMRKINEDEAKRLIEGKDIKSFIGHELTAQATAIILGIPVQTNRGMLKLSEGELIAITLNGRLPEGTVIKDINELKKIGYTLWHIIVE